MDRKQVGSSQSKEVITDNDGQEMKEEGKSPQMYRFTEEEQRRRCSGWRLAKVRRGEARACS